jgi:hypothetical protein
LAIALDEAEIEVQPKTDRQDVHETPLISGVVSQESGSADANSNDALLIGWEFHQ